MDNNIGWEKKNSGSGGNYDDSLIKNQINILDDKIDEIDLQLEHNTNSISTLEAHIDNIVYTIDPTMSESDILYILQNKNNIKVSIGEYYINEQILLNDNLNLEFANGASIIYSGSSDKAVIVGNNNYLKNFNLKANFVVKDTYGIFAENKKNLIIEGGSIEGFGFANIGLNKVENITIKNVISKNCGSKSDGSNWYGQGIWLFNCKEIQLNENTVTDNGMHGVQILSSENMKILNNTLSNNGDCGITILTSRGFLVNNNLCIENGINGGPYGGQGIQIVGSSDIASLNGIISNNHVESCKENGIELNVNCKDICVSNNICNNNSWAGIAVNPGSETIELSGNICKYNQNGILCSNSEIVNISGSITNYNNEYGIKIVSSTIVDVYNFTSMNNGQLYANRAGVVVEGSNNINVRNGRAYDTQETKTQSYGIRFYSCTNCECTSNYITGNKTSDYSGGEDTVINNYGDTNITSKGFKDKNGVRWLSGSGSPEGMVTANIGSIYLRTDGSSKTSLYLKESGTGTLGWVAK